MTIQIRRTLALSVATFAMLSAPVLLNHTEFPLLPDTAAMAAKGGNGGGNSGGNGGGSGGGNGGGKSSSSESGGGNSSSKSSASGKSQGASKGKKASTEGVLATATTAGAEKQRNIKAELAGLNSLKRNISGLMNSADPRMEGIRQFVIASAAAEAAEAELKVADDALKEATSAYLSMINGLNLAGDYPDYQPSTLQSAIEELNKADLDDPMNADLLAERDALAAALASVELQILYAASAEFTAAQQTAATAGAAADEDSLRAALLMAANANRASDTYLTDDIMAWANDILGVGDSRGLIDDYVASN